MRSAIIVPFLFTTTCTLQDNSEMILYEPVEDIKPIVYNKGTWQHFLQTLPVTNGEVVDYKGNKIVDQEKHIAIINYDIGNKDLQQCADAIIRLRAEYLYSQERFNEIQFYFTSGHLFSFIDYCKGKRPVVKGNSVSFINTTASSKNYTSLRNYLNIVYAYAGTISLAKELTPASGFNVGTIIITPGSPGHCSIIIDEAVNSKGEKLYKLAEGYTPAQSIYILKNPEDGSAWYKLKKDAVIKTSSYLFKNYKTGVFI